MKKLISMLLTLTLFISFTSCSDKDDTTTVSGTAAFATNSNISNNIQIVNNTVAYGIYHSNIMAVKNDGQTISDYENIPVMNDVRSISLAGSYNYTYFYIKNDNTLWAYGDNEYGQLGDGTGVDSQADSEPVKILDNVANIYIYSNTIFAVTNDKELYGWGFNRKIPSDEKIIFGNSEKKVYTPFKIMDDVVDVPELCYVIKSDATLWTWDKDNILANPYDDGVNQQYSYNDIMPITKIAENVKKYIGIHSTNGTWDNTACTNYTWIEIDNTLIYNELETVEDIESDEYGSVKKIISTTQIKDVAEVFNGWETLVFLKTDGTLWGKGVNTEGQLDDGTKVDKTEPIKIADNVRKYVDLYRMYYYILNDGTYWFWTATNPVPTKTLSSIYDVLRFERVLISVTGEVFSYSYGEKNIIFEDVKLS